MKSILKEKQELNLINCERIESGTVHSNSSPIRCTIPIKVNFPREKSQICHIHQTETVVTIKQAK
jgi:hypothetical protein